MYLNFTHLAIMNRLDDFYKLKYGVMERLAGDIYVNTGLPEGLELERYILHCEVMYECLNVISHISTKSEDMMFDILGTSVLRISEKSVDMIRYFGGTGVK